MWIYFGLISALFLSMNALCRKRSVKNNAVFPLLLATNSLSLFFLIPLFICTQFYPDIISAKNLAITNVPLNDHGFIAIKSIIMTGSWICGFYALKHLPITIVSPIRASSPIITFVVAFLIYKEVPVFLQWFGFILIIGAMFWYSQIGKKEGIYFKNNKWILAIVGATVLGSSSSIYDKFLLQYKNYPVLTIQFWFFFYVTIIMGLLVCFVYKPNKEKMGIFKWHWTIIATGVFSLLADYFYFKGLQNPEALITMMSAIKRCQLLFTVAIGGVIFKEQNKGLKLLPLAGVLIGVLCIVYGSTR